MLATETVKDEDSNLRPRAIVFLVRNNRLIKAAPEQLRHASERERLIHELREPVDLKWTFSKITQNLTKGDVEDISNELPSDDQWAHGDSEEQARGNQEQARGPRPPHRITGKRPLDAPRESQKSTRPKPGDIASLVKQQQEEFEAAWWSEASLNETESSFWAQEGAAISIEVDLPSSKHGCRRFMNNPEVPLKAEKR